MITIQTGTWPGWPDGVTIQLEEHTAAAVLTAARDYQTASGRNLHGDYLVLPVGGLRLPAWVLEMQWAFDHRNDTGATKTQSLAIYRKYNMDPASNARPSMSTHTLGICADIADNGFLAWLKTGGNAARYGLRFTVLNLNDLRHTQYIPGLATVALDVTGLNNTTKDMDMIERTLGRQNNTPGVYYFVNNVGSPVISEAHLASVQADLVSLYQAGDPYLVNKGGGDLATATGLITAVAVVDDIRLLGIIPGGGTSTSSTDLTPVLAAISALDAQDDTYQAALIKAVNDAAAKGGTPADVVAAFKAAL